MIWDNG